VYPKRYCHRHAVIAPFIQPCGFNPRRYFNIIEVFNMPLPSKVTQIMHKYQELFNQTFPGRLFCLYLVGSTALGAYREGKSDLDFLAVLNHELQPPEFTQLAGIHRAIAKQFPGAVLEGGYLTLAQLGKSSLAIPYYHDGRFIAGLSQKPCGSGKVKSRPPGIHPGAAVKKPLY
jgi:hypothetical protein